MPHLVKNVLILEVLGNQKLPLVIITATIGNTLVMCMNVLDNVMMIVLGVLNKRSVPIQKLYVTGNLILGMMHIMSNTTSMNIV
jgi:hypothetical protein